MQEAEHEIEAIVTWIESTTNIINLCLALVIFYLGIRIVQTMRFQLQRSSVRLFVAAAAVFAIKELVMSFGDRGSLVVHDACEILETIFISCLGVAMYLIVRSENLEISALHQQANRDRLTGLLNMGAFDQIASRRLHEARKNGLPVVLVMLDLDFFKQYNDTYGHEAGNIALQSVADTLRTATRENDLVARYGGEEFVLLLFASPDSARPTAERFRTAIEKACSPEHNPTLQRQLTASIGVALYMSTFNTLKELIEAADKQLYLAKQAGRNRVSMLNDKQPEEALPQGALSR